MACFDENTVIAFFASPRAREVAQRVDAHAADCKACRELLAAYAAMSPSDPSVAPVASPSESMPPKVADDSLARRLAHAQAVRRVGQEIGGKWRIQRLLGVGGMAQVFAAEHRNGKAVAVKLMRPELAVEPALVQRFLREAYAANRVAHPGAVAVHDDATTDDGVPFLVMDLLEGRTLRERLAQSGPLDAVEAARVIDQVLDVLAAAHAKGIVHRDVKPENLFETAEGAVRVLDFGIARLMEPGEGMTHSGVTMGTVGYMPPEQARGQMGAVDARSDVWAVGATLFTLLTGRAVHAASTHNEVLLLAMTAKVAKVRSLAPAIPPAIARVIDKAVAFDKGSRWDDARAMQRALRAALDRPETGAPELVAPEPGASRHTLARRRPAILWGGGIALVALVALGSAFAVARAERGASSAMAASATSLQASSVPEPSPPRALSVGAPVVAPQEAATTTATTAKSTPPAAPKIAAPRAHPPPSTVPSATASPLPPPPSTAAPASTMNPLGPRT